MSAGTFIRPDGKEKVTGSGRYTADLNLTGQLHAKLRYADHPHARLVRIDTTKARANPGVLAVLTHEDVPDVRYGIMVKDRRLFAKERVRFEADVIAAVAALTAELAAEATALIEVEYEPLPAVSDIEAAASDNAPLIHEEWASYEGDDEMGRRERSRLLHDRQGRRRGRARDGRRRRQEPLPRRRLPGCSHR